MAIDEVDNTEQRSSSGNLELNTSIMFFVLSSLAPSTKLKVGKHKEQSSKLLRQYIDQLLLFEIESAGVEGEFITTLPPNVERVLTGFIQQARSAFASDLRAVVLYGSGAEGKLRPTSDVNILLVLSAFDQKKADELREPLRLAQAAIRLKAMFLLDSDPGRCSLVR